MSEESFEAVGVKVDTSKLKSKHFLQTIDSGSHLAPRVRSDGEGSLEIIDEPTQPKLAFESFAGKIVEQKQSDATAAAYEEVRQNLQKLTSERIEFSVSGGVSASSRGKATKFESPMERYTRLCQEVKSFQQDMQQLSTDMGRAPSAVVSSVNAAVGSISALDLSKLIAMDCDRLSAELQSVSAPSAQGSVLQTSAPSSSSVLQTHDRIAATSKSVQSLLSEIDVFNSQQLNAAASPAAAPGSTGGGASGLTYELFLTSKDTSDTQSAVAKLDKRLSDLERFTGASAEPIPSQKSPSTLFFANLRSGIQQLHKRMQLVEKNKLSEHTLSSWSSDLDKLEKRAKALVCSLLFSYFRVFCSFLVQLVYHFLS